MTPDRRAALVTGASAGIGATIATELGRLGWRVAIGARRSARLAETADRVRNAGGEAYAHVLDVSDASSIESFFTAAEGAVGPLDVLVNNAAVATPGWLTDVPVDAIEHEVATNLTGPILLSRLAIASMRRRDARGDLVFITSDATRHPRPRMATYTATKGGLEAFAYSLAMELEGSGIRATTIRVGPTLSEFGFGWPMDSLEDLMSYWPRFGLQRHAGVLEPEAIARAVVNAVTAPPGVLLDTIEVQPEAPVGESGPMQPLPRPDQT
ncbi:MAG TPA: SDR family NAD(P)-dependent oxidoreductase [Acidimicrobiia bacterium]|jgi:NAD(P)-dependent dehydrogenase (short-subunit alcohol dehydrogenase family)